jgi:hypothetical protein
VSWAEGNRGVRFSVASFPGAIGVNEDEHG